MCNELHHKESEWTSDKKYRLADFFDRWWDIYKQSPSHFITQEQYKAVNAIRVCRTETLGIDHYACPDCGEITKVYHNCRNRFCPTCSWQDTVKWADRIKTQMLSISHRHVVMTLPHQLNELIKTNGSALLSVLLRTSADVFKDWMGVKYGVQPGIISVLHTFGETKDYHCHVHMIVSWGGIDKQTRQLVPIKGEYVDYDFLKGKFRKKFEAQIIEMFDAGTLLNSYDSRQSFMRFIHQVNKKKWIINLEPAMEIPTQVVRYIGRYSKRACLSEYKITQMEGEYIGFKYKDYKNLDIHNKPIEKELVLHYRDFFPRLLQHVPLKYFRIVRYYGAYSNRTNIPKEYLYGDANETENIDQTNWEQLQVQKTGQNPMICNHCQVRKIYIYTSIKGKTDPKRIIFKRVFKHPEKIPDQQVA
jgi:hypothetical protein